MCGDAHVAVVQRHANDEEILWQWSTCKRGEGLFGERAVDLHHAVAAEVENDDSVIVVHGPDGCARFIDHGEGRKVLIADARVLCAKGGKGSRSRGEWASRPLSMCLPAIFHNGPVGFVSIHGDDHATAAGTHHSTASVGSGDVAQEGFEVCEVRLGGAIDDISTVKKRVNHDFLCSASSCCGHQSLEMANMGVNIAVGQQPHEMNLLLLAGHDHLPGLAPDISIAEGFFHLFGALVEDSSGSHDVVPDLGIAHVGIGGKPYCHAVGMNREGNDWLAVHLARNGTKEEWCSS